MKVKKAKDFDAKTQWAPEWESGPISKMPPKFLSDEFFTKFPTGKYTPAILDAARRQDSSCTFKMLQRACMYNSKANLRGEILTNRLAIDLSKFWKCGLTNFRHYLLFNSG